MMRRFTLPALLSCLLAAATLGLSACGDDDGDGGGFGALPDRQDTSGKRGGKLTVLNASDVDSMDPAVAYYQFSYNVMFVTHRPLYQYQPDETETPSPDLATGPPEISPDGMTVTVKIRRGVRFSPPVNREVTSKDVKYAIERGFTENVAGPYASAYFGSIDGAPEEPGPYKPIPGIQTPDDQTLVFKLAEPQAAVLTGAMVLPLTAPVPQEYAEKYDAENPSTYNEHVVFTGPYMIENDDEGRLTGWEPKKRIRMIRNPNWQANTDFRPAYLDEIDIREGNDDTVAASRRVLRGESLVAGDYTIPPDALREASRNYPDRIALVPGGGTRYIALNTQQPPFDDINVRKAVIAGLDRSALRLTRGGPAVGDVPTHFISPDVPGFEEAGGAEGFGLDYLANPKGDREVSAKYFRAAGMQSGRYEGDEEILFVGDNDDPGNKTFLVAADQFRRMGFKLKTRTAPHEDLIAEICGSPAQNVDVCVNAAWAKDFNDPQTLLENTFRGENILPENNNNYPELNVPEIDEAMEKAAELTDLDQRAKAWADIDRMIMEQAPAAPFLWDKQASGRSGNVKGVIQRFNSTWDFAFTSLR
jgi:peptide/nickel transport system substrate-binding protein